MWHSCIYGREPGPWREEKTDICLAYRKKTSHGIHRDDDMVVYSLGDKEIWHPLWGLTCHQWCLLVARTNMETSLVAIGSISVRATHSVIILWHSMPAFSICSCMAMMDPCVWFDRWFTTVTRMIFQNKFPVHTWKSIIWLVNEAKIVGNVPMQRELTESLCLASSL